VTLDLDEADIDYIIRCLRPPRHLRPRYDAVVEKLLVPGIMEQYVKAGPLMAVMVGERKETR
jgi:hypothetical protein